MVSITVYVEGGLSSSDPNVQTVDNSAVFRESFTKFFSKKFDTEEFELLIQPIGTITQTKSYLEKIHKENIDAVILIDLDASNSFREQRIKSYSSYNTDIIYFMVQEMETWILSQPDSIEEYAQGEGWIRKRPEELIHNNILIKDKHPEDIDTPSEKLNTLFRQYFELQIRKGNKVRTKPKSYSKSKDGPRMIAHLNPNELFEVFNDVSRLFNDIHARSIK